MTRKRTLLIIEEDPDDVELTQLALADASVGWDWLVARDGAEGLDYLLSGKRPEPELVILDLNLPRLDGLELLEKLREEWGPGLRGLKIIVLSSSFERTDRQRAQSLGASAYIRKPISETDTAAMVRQFEAILADAS